MIDFRSATSFLMVLALAATLHAAPRDSVPYAPIANPLPDSGVDQKVRDSLTLKPSRVRVNQAGYRLTEVKAGMAKFYYVGTGLPFQVIDSATKTVAASGVLVSKGFSSGTKFSVRASNWAGGPGGADTRYLMSTDGLGTTIPSSPVMEGVLPTTLVEGGRYRVVVGTDTSATFLVSEAIYGMVRDGVLRFLGIQRSGAGPSWFHAPSHMKDGAVATPSAPGAYQGGWYDCGDHLKEPITMSFTLATLATLHATLAERDDDHYGQNHASTLHDGIPDVLAEARFGAEFFLRSWLRNGRKTANMVTGVGNFGADHGWWGRPENQDAMTEPNRGGWRERTLARIMGTGSIANQAAGLAFLSRQYRRYDSRWADTALMAAKDMYAYAKANILPYTGIAPYGQGTDKAKANLALAAIALLWTTKDPAYLKDLAYDRTIGPQGGDAFFMNSTFDGGWLAAENKFFDKARGTANFDWANIHPMVLYAFHKLILSNADSAKTYGVASESERVLLGRRVMNSIIGCLVAVSGTGASITLPGPGDGGGTTQTFQYDPNWFKMHAQQEWVWNRYAIANAAELFFYHDVASDFAAGKYGAALSGADWKLSEIRQLMVRVLDYQLGVNPWDVSMIMGLGDKNFNHPHHRAANPEGRNTPGAPYGYHVPVGALYGGYDPANATGSRDFWEDYNHTEVCSDGAAISLAAVMGLAAEVPVLPPKPTVKVVYVSDTLAQIEIQLDKFGTVELDYGAGPQVRTKSVASDSAGVSFKFVLGGLTRSTQYFFDVSATDLFGNISKTSTWPNPQPDGTPFSFTTKDKSNGDAQIDGVKVCNVTADSAEIMWYTPNGEYQSSICYGESPLTVTNCYDDIDVTGHPTKFHYVKIGGLKERTKYWFKVGSDGVWDDNGGQYHTFRTPVRMADFGIYSVKYDVGGMPALAINVLNNEPRGYDSLTLRVYVRSKDTLAMTGHFIGQPPRNVPVRFAEAVQARYDICQAYDGAGFNHPCSDSTWGKHPLTGNAWSWGQMGAAVQLLSPVKMPETYDPTDNTYTYYFDLPLGPTMMVQGSRIRFDVIFADKQVDAKIPTTDQRALFKWIRGFTPNQGTLADTGWIEQGAVGPEIWHTWGKATSDWSFQPHSVAKGDPVDYPGMIEVAGQSEADALIDAVSDEVPLNPYMTVYRKGEFVYGFSPSAIEQSTKKTYWGVDVALDKPFDVPNGTTIAIDQASATLRVRGTADVFDKLTPSAKGVVTDIWVNGTRLTDAERALAAVKDPATGKWTLDIPVRMAVGGRDVDITIFGGAGNCADTATTCESGCAFYNASFFVQFTRGNYTASSIALRTTADLPLPADPLVPDAAQFHVVVADGNANASKTAADVVTVRVFNPVRRDTATLTLTETGPATGIFRTTLPVSGVKKAATGTNASEVSFYGGDTLWVLYRDKDDADDSAKTFVWAEVLYPTPVDAGFFDTDCDGKADEIRATFDKNFDSKPDSVFVVHGDPRSETLDSFFVRAAQIAHPAGALNKLVVALPATIAATTRPTGTLRVYVRQMDGPDAEVSTPVADRIAPRVLSASMHENFAPGTTDTVIVELSEPLPLAGPGWPFLVANGATKVGATGLSILSATRTDATRDLWKLAVAGNAGGAVLKQGYSLKLDPASTLQDAAGNKPELCATGATISLVVKPVPLASAYLRDSKGDGAADQIVVRFVRRLRALDVADSFLVAWAGETRSTSSWTTRDSTEWTLAVDPSFAQGATRGTGADGSGLITYLKGIGATERRDSIALTDSVSPILTSATLRFGSSGAPDTLVVRASEPLDVVDGAEFIVNRREPAAGMVAISAASDDAVVWRLVLDSQSRGYPYPGDEVRLPTASSRLTAANGTAPGGDNPWVVVRGGDRPPRAAWYEDSDGDGRVDRAVLEFVRPVARRPAFRFAWPDATGERLESVVVDSTAFVLSSSGLQAVIDLPTPFVFGVTSCDAQRHPFLGAMLQDNDGIVDTGAFAIADSVDPVLLSASVRYASGDGVPDTLRVRWSERLAWSELEPLIVRRDRQDRREDVRSAGVKIHSDSLGGDLLFDPADEALTEFRRGDSLRLAPASKGTVTDRFGNAAEDPTHWVDLLFGARPPRFELEFEPRVLKYEGWQVPTTGPEIQLQVRARGDSAWQTADGSEPAAVGHTIGPVLSLNQPLRGTVVIYDKAGIYVASVDLTKIEKLLASGAFEPDPSGMYQIRLAWNGRAVGGNLAASGVFTMRLVLYQNTAGEGEEPQYLMSNRLFNFGWYVPSK